MKTIIGVLSLSLLPIVMISSRGDVKDIDGNTYKTVKIGDQEWMAENLNVAHYHNGDKIPEARTSKEWKAYATKRTGAWCYYDNDAANGKKYGKLFNWYAVNDPRGLAPKGWHVPSDAEWATLTANLGRKEIVGVKMKSNNGWVWDMNGTNESGFAGLPGGLCDGLGMFHDIGYGGLWWSSTERSTRNAWIRDLSFDDVVGRQSQGKQLGLSVRCVRD